MSQEHEQVADAYNSVDPNAEYEPETPPQEPTPQEPEEGIDGHHVAPVEEDASQVDEPEVPAYEPNYMFKAGGKEMEFDERVRSFIKDKETEEYFRDMMSKAYGLDEIKENRDKLKQQYEKLQPEYENITTDLGRLAHYRDTNNWDAFFKTLGVKEDQVLQYAQQRLQYHDMTPEQKLAYDNQVNTSTQQYDLAHQNQMLQQQVQNQIVQAKKSEVGYVLARPEIREFAQNFDQRMGKQGAFEEEVWNRGKYHAMVNKQDITAEQAVNEVLKMVGAGDLEQPQAPNPQAAPAGPTQPAAKPPVIPKVASSGASPTRPVVKSLDDIRQRRREMFGS